MARRAATRGAVARVSLYKAFLFAGPSKISGASGMKRANARIMLACK
jgi:hypothetical protein